MRCPICGHDNSLLATCCAACGSPLPANLDQETIEIRDDASRVADATEELGTPPARATEERPYVAVEAPQPTVEERPRILRRTPQNNRKAPGFFGSHQRGIAVGIALLVVGIIATAWIVFNVIDVPSYEQIESDLADLMPSYAYDGGAYGPDLTIPLSSVSVTERSANRNAGTTGSATGLGPLSYDVEAEAVFDDGTIRVVRNVAVVYAREEGSWKLANGVSEQGISISARSGIDEQKVLANMGGILASVDTGGVALSDIYAGGSFDVVDNTFTESPDKDTSLDDVTIRCRREGTFYAYEGTVVARFAFESGMWALRSASSSTDATTRTYDPLVGTWHGTFASTSSTGGGNCYGASGHDLVVNIQSVGSQDTGHGQVQGTISAMAHYHAGASKSQPSDEGDTYLEDVPFTGVIDSEHDGASGSSLVIECTTGGSAEGNMSFTLSFGTSDDPTAAKARIVSSYEYEDMLLMLIPLQMTDTFTDTYILSRA